MRRIIRRIIIKTNESLHGTNDSLRVTNDANLTHAPSPKVCPLCSTPLIPPACLPLLPANTSSAVAKGDSTTSAAAGLLAAGLEEEENVEHSCSDAE